MPVTVQTVDGLSPTSPILDFMAHSHATDLPAHERRIGSNVEANIRTVVADARDRRDTFIHEVDDNGHTSGYVLVNDCQNPWTQLREGFVYLLWMARDRLSEGSAGPLIESLEEHGRAAGWHIVRMEVPEVYASTCWYASLAEAGWSISGILPCAEVAKQVHRSSAVPGGVTVRPAEPADHAFAVDCLLESIHLGLSDYELSVVHPRTLRDNVEQEFREALAQRRAFSYVAEQDGRLVAHATAEWSDNAVMGIREALLHDILVREGLDGRGVGSALELEVFRECHRHSVSLLRSTLSFEHVSEERLRAVSSRLHERGWWFSSRMLYKLLRLADRTDAINAPG